MTWTQPMCENCWTIENPASPVLTVVLVEEESECCCMCGNPTSAGIYIRRDPETVNYPAA